MSERRLCILQLEDSPLDQRLVAEALSKEGLLCEFFYAKSRLEFEAGLKRGGFDLILSDYSLPDYHGTAALHAARQSQPQTPFLFVSGTMGETQVVESLKAGATDYVLKSHLERLAAAVRRALREAEERAERKRTEEALRVAQQRLGHLLAKSPAIIYALRTEDNAPALAWVTENVELLLGYTVSEACADGWWARAIHAEDTESALPALHRLFTNDKVTAEYRLRHKSGEYRWVRDERRLVRDAAGQPTEIVGSWTDITEHKRLEDQFRQAQKMEAIGQLAGGVAHDFNNLLAVILGNTELLLAEEQQLPADFRPSLKQVVAASQRAAILVRQLLAFGRKQVLQSQPLLLEGVIHNMLQMLTRIIGENIHLNFRPSAALAYIQADPGMMEQVLMNLLVNARDAMPAGGTLNLSTEQIVVDASHLRDYPEAREGQFVCLRVDDTGAGIPPEILPRIFEPFFTTKGPGKGTGLGLATVFGIVKQHQGWLEVVSQLGKGTSFRIYFPVIPSPPALAADSQRGPDLRGGPETLLLVEDDDAVRLTTRRLLESVGYRLIEAATAREAKEIWVTSKDDIALVLTDLLLPEETTGRELSETLRAERPNLKVIFMSGYSPDMAGKDTDFFRRTKTHFLQKPCAARTLIQTVRSCLDESPPAAG